MSLKLRLPAAFAALDDFKRSIEQALRSLDNGKQPRAILPITDYGAVANLESAASANKDAIQEALDYDLGSGVRKTIIIPYGVWWIDEALLVRNDTDVICFGEIKAASTYVGVGATGSLVGIRHSRNVTWRGGVLNGNDTAIEDGFNGLAISAPQASTSARTANVHISDVIIRNCVQDDTAAPTTFGAVGGKGFTVQFGCDGITLSNITVENCAFPFSVEGRVSNDGATYNVGLSNISGKNCTYGPYFNGTSSGQAYLSVVGRNLSLYDCGIDAYADGGLVNGKDACGLDLEFRIVCTSGRVSLVRGGFQYSRMAFRGLVDDLHDVVNNEDLAGLTSIASRAFRVEGFIQIAGTHYGYVHTHDSGLASLYWDIDLKYAGTLANLFAYTGTSYKFNLHDVDTGKRFFGEVSEAWAIPTERESWLAPIINLTGSLKAEKDGNNVYLTPDSSHDLVLRDRLNATQARVRSGEFVVQNRTRFGTSGAIIDAYGTGTPEGAVTAGIGSTFRRTDGGASTSFYVKESGTGDTGWVAK